MEDDLYRRDLTINAMAKDDNGSLIDPFNGQTDLNNRVLRHVSPAFVEDPLRVLRVAKFAARFARLGFTVAPETLALMHTITASGELEFLAKERLWQETLDALSSPQPDVYFAVLHQCGALEALFPELIDNYADNIDTCPARLAMNTAASEESDTRIRFACGLLPWDACLADPEQTHQLLSQTLSHLKVPSSFQEVLLLVSQHLPTLLALEQPTAKILLTLLEQIDAFRRKDRFLLVLAACDHLLDAAKAQRQQKVHLKQALTVCQSVDVQALIAEGHKGKALAGKIHEVRLEKIAQQLEKGQE